MRIDYRPTTDEDRRLFKIWYDALKVPGKTLEQTLAEEVAGYFGTTVDEVVDFWYDSTPRLRDEWIEQHPTTSEDIIHYYDTSTTYIYELSYWHTLHMNLGLIEHARSVELALSHGGRRYLDFGGGTGSNIILFHKYGFECTLADISTSLLSFARSRFERRGIADATIIDLKSGALPDDYFDFVTAVEVLEHVPDPLETMHSIVRATKPGGLISAWVPFFDDDLRPQHIVTDMGVADRFSTFGLTEVSRDDAMLIRIYRKH